MEAENDSDKVWIAINVDVIRYDLSYYFIGWSTNGMLISMHPSFKLILKGRISRDCV
jgi:hypothetical protein